MSVELVMSEFGAARLNAGGAALDAADRLNPTLSGFLSLFPDAQVVLYTDQETAALPGVRIVKVRPPFSSEHPRYGWRAHDYYQVHGLLESRADVAIAMDADMKIVSGDFSVIATLAQRFGLAVPMNPRLLARVDGLVGSDSTYRIEADETRGTTFAYNLTPMAFGTAHAGARAVLAGYLERLQRNPGRGAVHLSQACFEQGYSPCLLPAQWCVCTPADFDSRHVWPNAIALHIGHADVEPRWNMEKKKSAVRARLRKLKGLLR